MPATTDEEAKDQKPQELDQKSEKRQSAPGDQGNKSQGNGHNDGGRREGDQKDKDQKDKSDSGEKDDDNKGKKDDDKKEEEKKPVDPATKRRRIIIGVAVGVVVLVAGIAWWLYSRTYESTDDAQINGHPWRQAIFI
jgi:cobalamin biosynthesis Mg chelatase CobN